MVCVARCMPHVARCMPHVARCMPHVARCMLPASRCMLPASRCTLRAGGRGVVLGRGAATQRRPDPGMRRYRRAHARCTPARRRFGAHSRPEPQRPTAQAGLCRLGGALCALPRGVGSRRCARACACRCRSRRCTRHRRSRRSAGLCCRRCCAVGTTTAGRRSSRRQKPAHRTARAGTVGSRRAALQTEAVAVRVALCACGVLPDPRTLSSAGGRARDGRARGDVGIGRRRRCGRDRSTLARSRAALHARGATSDEAARTRCPSLRMHAGWLGACSSRRSSGSALCGG